VKAQGAAEASTNALVFFFAMRRAAIDDQEDCVFGPRQDTFDEFDEDISVDAAFRPWAVFGFSDCLEIDAGHALSRGRG
jgi:hypothetical protein